MKTPHFLLPGKRPSHSQEGLLTFKDQPSRLCQLRIQPRSGGLRTQGCTCDPPPPHTHKSRHRARLLTHTCCAYAAYVQPQALGHLDHNTVCADTTARLNPSLQPHLGLAPRKNNQLPHELPRVCQAHDPQTSFVVQTSLLQGAACKKACTWPRRIS